MTTYSDAQDSVLREFDTVWNASNLGLSYTPKVYWPGEDDATTPTNAGQLWAKVRYAAGRSVRKSLGKPAVFTTSVMIYIQIFAPADKQALANCRNAAMVAAAPFRNGQNSAGVRYMSASIFTAPTETKWHSVRLEIEVEYDEFV